MLDRELAGFSRYPAARALAPLVERAADAADVPAAVVMAVIAVESGFHTDAYRFEPSLGEASYGLMQVLASTARALGYMGELEGLYDPRTNVTLGARYLAAGMRARGEDVAAAVSRFNNGSGKRRADGSFPNQAYVNRVARAMGLFDAEQAALNAEGIGAAGHDVGDNGGDDLDVLGGGDLEAGYELETAQAEFVQVPNASAVLGAAVLAWVVWRIATRSAGA